MKKNLSASKFIDIKKHYFQINKNEFFNSVKQIYKNSLTILEQFKSDFDNIIINLNGNRIKKHSDLLEYILRDYNYYLERILLLSSNTIFVETAKIIKNNISTDLHILKDTNKETLVEIRLNHLIKQIVITNSFKLVHLDSSSDIILKKSIDLQLIIDISNTEPILVILKILN